MASVNNVPGPGGQLVDGGPALFADGKPRLDDRGTRCPRRRRGHQTRQGRVAISRPKLDADGQPLTTGPDKEPVWDDVDDVVQGIVLLRKGQESLPALKDVMAKIDELNDPAGCRRA